MPRWSPSALGAPSPGVIRGRAERQPRGAGEDGRRSPCSASKPAPGATPARNPPAHRHEPHCRRPRSLPPPRIAITPPRWPTSCTTLDGNPKRVAMGAGSWELPDDTLTPLASSPTLTSVQRVTSLSPQTPVVSVVIPTRGRAAKLAGALRALSETDPQAPPFEVVVALDGEDAEAEEVARRGWSFPVQCVAQRQQGAAAARNLGAGAASGSVVLFLNDDTRVHGGCLLAHADFHARQAGVGVLGRTDWDPNGEITPYMRWLAPSGHQFNFSRLTPHAPVPWDATWATNLSVPRHWLSEEPFDMGFQGAGMEDTEWGYRLHRRGFSLVYAPEALCFHDHRYDGPRDYRWRARLAGQGARRAVRKHPELAFTLAAKPCLAFVARSFTLALPRRGYRQRLWDWDFRWHYVVGLLLGR